MNNNLFINKNSNYLGQTSLVVYQSLWKEETIPYYHLMMKALTTKTEICYQLILGVPLLRALSANVYVRKLDFPHQSAQQL